MDDDVARLQRGHPGWQIGTVWATAASGPDARRFTATRDGVLLTAWTPAELARDIRLEERAPSRPRAPGGTEPAWPDWD